MKKVLLSLMVCTMALNAGATNYLIRSGRSDGTQIPFVQNYTREMTVSDAQTDASVEGGQYWTYKSTSTDTWSMYGITNTASDTFDALDLKNPDTQIVFMARSTSANCSWRIKLENTTHGGAVETPFTLEADGQWHEITYNFQNDFAAVYNNTQSGDILYLFSVVLNPQSGTLVGGESIDIADARYVVPDPDYKVTFSASADDITMNSASINYSYSLTEKLADADVKVYMDGEEMSESPILLTDLTPSTAYEHTLKAVATLDGVEYESSSVKVSFTTLRDASTAAVWSTIVNGVYLNAYIDGEGESTRHNIPVSHPLTIYYNTDGTLTFEVTCPGNSSKIVGLNPQININGTYHTMSKDANNSALYTYTTTSDDTYSEEATPALFLYNSYNQSATRFDVNGYTVGSVGAQAEFGEPASFYISGYSNTLKVGDTCYLYTTAQDAAGHYLLDETVTYTITDGDSLVFEGDQLKAQKKGDTTLTISCDNGISTEYVVTVYASRESSVLDLKSMDSVTDSSNPITNAFDGNEGSELQWSCAETEKHYLYIDFGKEMWIEGIHLVWEGACAKAYTITLTNNRPAEFDATSSENAPKRLVMTSSDGVYSFSGVGTGGTIRTDFTLDDGGVDTGRYLLLNTTEAYNTGWGIKLKEISVQGAEKSLADGVATIESDENAEAVYYNLQGIRVNGTPTTPGIYICNGRKFAVK